MLWFGRLPFPNCKNVMSREGGPDDRPRCTTRSIYVPNAEQPLGPGRVKDLPGATEVSAAFQGEDDVEHQQPGNDRWRARRRDPFGRQKAETFTQKGLADNLLRNIGAAIRRAGGGRNFLMYSRRTVVDSRFDPITAGPHERAPTDVSAGQGPFQHVVAGEGFEPSKLSRWIYSPTAASV